MANKLKPVKTITCNICGEDLFIYANNNIYIIAKNYEKREKIDI